MTQNENKLNKLALLSVLSPTMKGISGPILVIVAAFLLLGLGESGSTKELSQRKHRTKHFGVKPSTRARITNRKKKSSKKKTNKKKATSIGKFDLEGTPTVEDSNDALCFPASALVETEGGQEIRMEQLAIGDKVRTGGGTMYSGIIMFTHRLSNSVNPFVRICVSSGNELRLTSGHYLYVNGALAAAKTVSVGSLLRLSNGTETTVVSVEYPFRESGLYNPITLSGDIIVDGIRCSSYTTAVDPMWSHAILTPFRSGFRWIGIDGTFGALEAGPPSPAAGEVIPHGKNVVW